MPSLCSTQFRSIFVLTVLFSQAAAHAGVYKDVQRALALFDIRVSGEKNPLGDGATVEGNAFYNNTRFNFGLTDLTLNGALHGSVGWTRRTLKDLEFTLDTGGAPLSYVFNINDGIQDLTATGSVLININTDINALGFYDRKVQISNRGTYTSDGFFPTKSGTLDFDVGPTDVSGNIFADILGVVTEPLFAATGTVNPFFKFSSKATKEIEAQKTADELRARVAAGEVLSDQEIATLVNNTIMAAVLGQEPSDHLFDDVLLPQELADSLQIEQTLADRLLLTPTPEPTTGLLLGMGLIGLLRRRRIA